MQRPVTSLHSPKQLEFHTTTPYDDCQKESRRPCTR